MEVTFDMIRSSPEIRTYITQADASLTALGFTEHSFAHVGKCAHVAAQILTELGYTPREVELAQIAAYMHDIGNVAPRPCHQRCYHGFPHSGQHGHGSFRRGSRHHRYRPSR